MIEGLSHIMLIVRNLPGMTELIETRRRWNVIRSISTTMTTTFSSCMPAFSRNA
jgi:hypothetical protein